MVSIAELRRPEFSLRWDEAVALVAEVSTGMLARVLSSVPDPESIILTPDGTLRMLHDGPPDAALVKRLGGLLEMMLASVVCPPELRTLVTDSAADPPVYATVQAFADALAFFERPGRRDLLKALADRTSDMELQARANVELEHLQARARNQPNVVGGSPTIPAHVRRLLLLFAAAVVLVGALAGAVYAFINLAPARAAITERIRARADRLAHKGLEVIGLTPRAAESPAPAVTSAPRMTPRISRPKPREFPETVSIAEIEVWTTSDPPSPSVPESPEPVVHDNTIYTADEKTVEPAVLMRPQLPSEPPSTMPEEDIGVLEIVVSATGAVEHVRLISSANRFHDRMIVSAAKAWSFAPATKDGRPVRYRTHIRVTL